MSCYFSRNAVETLINSGIFKIVDILLMENEGSDKKPSYSQAVINLIDALFPSATASRRIQNKDKIDDKKATIDGNFEMH